MTSSPILRLGFPLKEDDISETNSSRELTLGVFLGSVIIPNIYRIQKYKKCNTPIYNSNMSKFVIFATARSGSTSLAEVLGKSKDVKLCFEPFNADYPKWNPG